ncbi:MAG: hypothetical protein OJF49_002217 [Ktedonobacterales bacterium]|jgi:hypothetical protein|nr:MAG: hypothetical protein OJF49_002217 [Ktedonobacterales bacterium]
MGQATQLRAYQEIAAFFARGPSPEEISAFRLSGETIARIRELLDKNSAGTLMPDEADELDQLGQLNRILLLIRSQLPRQEHPEHSVHE